MSEYLPFALKVIIASCGLVGTTAVSFIAVRIHKWIEKHEVFKDETTKATTILIPNQIKALSDDVSETHNAMLDTFASEIVPLKGRVDVTEKDIHKLKRHTKFRG